MNIGYLLCDCKLKKYFTSDEDYTFIEFPYSEFKEEQISPKDFYYNDLKIDRLLVYSHLHEGKRSNNTGVKWIRDLRMLGFRTPVLLLTWQNIGKFRMNVIRENPFAATVCKDSCQILRLPQSNIVILDNLITTKEIKKDLHEQQIKENLFFQINHILIGSNNINTLKNLLKSEEEFFNLNEKYRIIFNEIISFDSIEKIKFYRDNLKIF